MPVYLCIFNHGFSNNVNNWNMHIDSLRMGNALVHGWGNLHGTAPPPTRAWLEIQGEDAQNFATIPCILGKLENGRNGLELDFVLYGRIGRGVSTSPHCSLIMEWPDKQQVRLEAPAPQLAPAGRGLGRFIHLPWKHYISRGMQLLRNGQIILLLGKALRMARALIASGHDPVSLLQWVQTEGKPLVLVIDHDLGGGATIYRTQLMQKLEAENLSVLLLTAHHGILAYQLTAKRKRKIRSAFVNDLETLFTALSAVCFERAIFNNILSFPQPVGMVTALTAWLQYGSAKHFLFLVHDHYCVCPAWLLLDQSGHYCGVPDTTVCDTCLPANQATFISFASGESIGSWRAAWLSLLNKADEIRCFSHASRQILLRAHPGLEAEKVTVVPHDLSHLRIRPVRLNDPGWPIIGVIGHISHYKGGQVVCDLARHIRATGGRARLVIIGTIDSSLDKEVATVTGPYRPEQLPRILETYGVNIGFFPSICPETFSFVTEEMIKMELPILAFDLGAPGERVAAYRRGLVIPRGTPGVILQGIESLYQTHIQSKPST